MAGEREPRSEIALRLGGVQVGLRPELEVTRHIFRGEVSYVVRDPISFSSHRFDSGDYEILTALHCDHTLDEVFRRLVAEGAVGDEDEERFYRFVLSLHRLAYLNLPIPDGKRLYERHRQIERQRRRERLMAAFFLRVPLWNPDPFLSRTARWAAPLFSRAAIAGWCVLVISAGLVAARRSTELAAELGDVFALENLPLLWLTIVLLKAIHELGHAWCTKALGGHVPEMGVYLIAFTPCAYVDASAAWGFSRKGERIFVGLAGMYFELAIAAVALFGWAATDPGPLHSLCTGVIVLASAVTIGFNINPLMRFDGYYVFSDLIELPNLRQRASTAMVSLGKRIALGPRPAAPGAVLDHEERLPVRLALALFGALSAIYRVLVIVSISLLIAGKFSIVGLFMAGAYVAIEVAKLLRRILDWLWFSPETAPVRRRAVVVSALLIAGTTVALFGAPFPSHVQAEGVVGTEGDSVVRAERAGFLDEILTAPGRAVRPGQVIATLADPGAIAEVIEARGSLERAEARAAALAVTDLTLAAREAEAVRFLRGRLVERERGLAGLTLASPDAGWVARSAKEDETGRWVAAGEEIATVAAGRWTVVAYLDAGEMAAMTPHAGDVATFRPKAHPSATFSGRVLRIEPVATDRVDEAALTRVGGGEIGIDPVTLRAGERLFRITIALDPHPEGERVRHGATGRVRFGAEAEPLALLLWRRLLVFLNRLDAA